MKLHCKSMYSILQRKIPSLKNALGIMNVISCLLIDYLERSAMSLWLIKCWPEKVMEQVCVFVCVSVCCSFRRWQLSLITRKRLCVSHVFFHVSWFVPVDWVGHHRSRHTDSGSYGHFEHHYVRHCCWEWNRVVSQGPLSNFWPRNNPTKVVIWHDIR